MPYAFNNDKSKWNFNGLCYFPGDTINLSTNFYRGAGSLTNSSKTIGFTIPTKPIVNAQISVFNLSINVRHPDGYYPTCYGGTYSLGPTLLELAFPSSTDPQRQAYHRAVETINAYILDGGIRFDVAFKGVLGTASNPNVTARNNVPVGIDASATIYLA